MTGDRWVVHPGDWPVGMPSLPVAEVCRVLEDFDGHYDAAVKSLAEVEIPRPEDPEAAR